MPAPLMTLRPMGKTHLAWVFEQASLEHGESELEQLPPPPEGTRVRLLVPGDRVLHAQVKIAAKNPRLIAQALPYALEEQLAEDPEQVHLAHGPRAADGQIDVRVVNRAWLEDWLARLRAHGLEPEAVYAELDLIPPPNQGWRVLDIGGLRLARNSTGEALALEPELLASVLGDVPVFPLMPPHPMLWLHQALTKPPPINLLGRPKGIDWGIDLGPWRPALMLASLAFLLSLGLMAYETHRLEQERALMQAQILHLAREAAPEVKRWVNPLTQLRQLTRTSPQPSHSSNLLPLLAELAQSLQNRPDVKLGRVHYQGAVLEAKLSAREDAKLRAVLTDLRQKPRLMAEWSEPQVEGESTTTRLRIQEKRP